MPISYSNDPVVQLQLQQAEEARQKEIDRQKRIDAGLLAIKNAFEGAPIMGRRTVTGSPDLSGLDQLQPGQTIAGLTLQNTPSPYYTGDLFGNINLPQYELTDATGKPIYSGLTLDAIRNMAATQPISYEEEYDTGERTPGFDDAFYNTYGQSIQDYYMPQLGKQYEKARDDLAYGLARAGTLRSTAANKSIADLYQENEDRKTDVRNRADTAVGELKSRVTNERAKAEAQLYATENPDVATNQALATVRDIYADKPDLSPLAGVFNALTVGGANVYGGLRDQKYANQIAGIGRSNKPYSLIG